MPVPVLQQYWRRLGYIDPTVSFRLVGPPADLTPSHSRSQQNFAMDSLISRANTTLPKSLKSTDPVPGKARKYNHIANKKLRTTLQRQSVNTERSKGLLRDAELLLPNEAGQMEVEGDMDRTWRISQDEIVSSTSVEAGRGRKEFVLDGGPYRARYTRNGRHMAIVGQKGHVSTFDWQTGTMHSELQLRETCRDITYVLLLFSNIGSYLP
jgi:U3 small nucleolar RNA-associated protein 7